MNPGTKGTSGDSGDNVPKSNVLGTRGQWGHIPIGMSPLSLSHAAKKNEAPAANSWTPSDRVECADCGNTVYEEGHESVEIGKATYMRKLGKPLGFPGDRIDQRGQWVRVSWDEKRCAIKGTPLMPNGFKHRCDYFKPIKRLTKLANKPDEVNSANVIGKWGDAEISAYLTKLDELTTEGIPLQQAERLAGEFVDSRQQQPKF